MIIKPKPLQQGDSVAIIAPSSPTDPHKVDKAVKAISALGLNPIIYPSCYKKHGHLAGLDWERAKDINDAFSNPDIKGIICLKGGMGSTRLLTKLDYEMISQNPKVFVGYSDITGLHMAFNKLCRMVTYHGPMALSDMYIFSEDKISIEAFTCESLYNNIFTSEAAGAITNPAGHKLEVLVDGVAEGELIGGNLSLLVSTLGSPYELDAKGKILFIEDTNEATYVVDRMLTALALAGKFKDCAGVILGTWNKCLPETKNSYEGEDLSLQTIFEEVIMPFGKPTILNFPAGHSYPQVTMAFGTIVRLDTSKPEVVFWESGNEY